MIIKNSYSCERLPVTIHPNSSSACTDIAQEIAKLIRGKAEKNEKAVLGLATGASPVGVYQELVRIHKEQGLSFSNVVTFNLDEYYPIKKSSILSYNYFMRHHLFDHVDIENKNIHIPDGELNKEDVREFCLNYEALIDSYGGIDIQLLGIGRTGHIGFNEPPSFQESLTGLVKLDPITISDAKREFIHEELVPRRAITMGIKSVFKARKIFMLAWGLKKADVVQKMVEGPVSEGLPASFLQKHGNVDVLIDPDASRALTREKTPWLVTLCEWKPALVKRAVIWLGLKLEKPILKLTEDDYRLNDLGDLLAQYHDVHELNVSIFTSLQHTITGWPGGKPGSDDTHRPVKSLPEKKKVIVFSPHPDDDVISMGGTFIRLADQEHEVHVAYQTSGNIAVHDDEAIRFMDFMSDFAKESWGLEKEADLNAAKKALAEKDEGEPDPTLIRQVKGLIRKSEAIAGARFSGLQDENIHFLNLPFYETGSAQKAPFSQADIDITVKLLEDIKPDLIFAAGDLRDPHGTHEVCLDVIVGSMEYLRSQQSNWIKDCSLWMYRGAWQEWPIEEIQMAVPLSPSDLYKKRRAIFKHQSQKDTPVFPGTDSREFWQRSEDRNRETAQLYDQLGLTEYEAIEAFVKMEFDK
ncbi:MAG: glucosamine-6-phosphate deaminase [Cyclobacteriaceae bacterium]